MTATYWAPDGSDKVGFPMVSVLAHLAHEPVVRKSELIGNRSAPVDGYQNRDFFLEAVPV